MTASWTPIVYTITYEGTKGADNSNPVTYTIESATIILADVSVNGYSFDGWTKNGTSITEIAQGSTGNITLIANWTPIGYEITYHNVEGATNNNAPTYDVEDEPLALLDASKIGYTFLGWYDVNDNKMNEIPVGTIGNLDLYAKWEAIEYTATFMDGEDEVDKITFTVETESLEEPGVPEHIGYTGIWESYTLGLENITINAVYTPIVYTITYEGTKGTDNSNPVTYTIESDTITLDDISVNGYTFDGWTKDGKEVTEITQGSTGNIVLTANWTAIKYSITYMYDSAIGDYADTSKNPATYTIEDDFDFIALVNKTTGYTFDGWYTEKNVGTGTKVNGIEAGSTGDITIYAQWALDEYIITYHNANGITNTNAKTYTVETDTFEIFDISKNGYTFGGWYSDSEFGTKITEIAKGTTGNIDLYAKWTPVEYTIEYVLYGGTYAEGISNPIKYTIEDKITFASPSLDGYTFVGFFTLAEGGVRVTGVENGTVGNKTLYARYVAFDTNGGSDIEYELTISGNKMSMPTEPKMDYYTFDGWYTDEALTKKFDFSIPTKTLTLYAKFVPTVYKITYVLNGGTNPQNQVLEYTVEDMVVNLLNPTKTGYTFVGWFTDDKFTSSVVTKLENEHGDKTFYANYKINQYTISFNTNAGTEVEPITQNYQTSVSAPSSPAKNGYKFEGWYSDSALKNKYTFTTMPAKDITLYAKWSLENYKITYNLEGGTNNKNNPSTFNIQSADITLQAPTKTGYKFVGWYTDNGYDNSITKIANGTYGNIELYAKWEIITYTITYNVNGATHSNPTTYTVETDLAYLADATLKGHTFGGWYKESAYSTRVYQIGGGETGNITLYAKFTANTYDVYLDGTDEASFDVSFNLNGGSGTIAKQTITESNSLKYPTIPTRSGYAFGGWYADKDCAGDLYDFTALITSDITLYAKWVKTDNSIAVNSNVTVNLNGREEQKFTFVPLVNGNVTFTTIGTYDTLGILYDEGGNVLKLDDDTGSDGINFQIVFNVTAGEIYTISVSSYSSATNGTSTLYVSGSNTVNAGGYVITGNKAEATYGQSFTLPVPSARDGYKFLGYADKNGTMYTDGTGTSVKAWDKDEATLLVSVWERTVYTVTFVTSGGSELDPVELAFGDRLDISKYVTTRANYTFDCWMYEGAEFEATTMPDHNITLTAKWKTFALGEIKYDTTKLAVSVNDEITADLFGALCLDTNGQKAEFTVAVSGTQEVGETISVRLVAKSGNKTKQVTITGVQVYGAPTLDFDSTVDYVNLVGGMTANHFSASGVDTFGNTTEIKVYIDGDYKAGDIVKVTIESIDPAGNVTKGYVENVKAYGLPEIIYNEEKTAISVNDTLNADLFGASAKDSFGNDLTVKATLKTDFVNGDVYTYTTSTTKDYVYFTAFNSEVYTLYFKNGTSGERTYISVYCVTTKSYVLKNNYYTDYGSYSTLSFNVTAGNQYYICTSAYTSSYTTNFSMYLKSATNNLTAGSTIPVQLIATDSKGNKMNINIPCKVYGAPTITDAVCTDIKETDSISAELLGVTATDTFGNNLGVSLFVKNGTQTAGTTMVVFATVTDVSGNIATKYFTIKVYGTPTISYDREGLKTSENISECTVAIVQFDLNGGRGTIPDQIVTSNNGLEYPSIPTRDRYAFNGWYTTPDCSTLYDFTSTITSDLTLYAGWIYVHGYLNSYDCFYRDIYNNYNSEENAYELHVVSSSVGYHENNYFTCLNDGKYNIYYKKISSTGTLYMEVHNVTQNKTIKSKNTSSYSSISFDAKAGDVILIYIDLLGSNSSCEYYWYVTGGSLPSDGGTTLNDLNAKAYDSFGNELSVCATLKYGDINKANTYVVYTLIVTDATGNTYSIDTEPLGVYDANDIELNYNEYMSDLAKLSSNGSEFDASATDSFGNACTITIEAADGTQLKGGQTTSIVIVATDKAGNRVVSEPIENIRIFDMPTIEIDEWLTEDTDIEFMATVYDSFGNEIYAEITYEGNQVAGETVVITVKATDDAGNELNLIYTYVVHTGNAHVSSEWIIDKEADRCIAGEKHKECKICKKILEIDTIPAPDNHTAVSNGNGKGKCSVCGKEQQYARVDEDTILFGTYPQTEVTDSILMSTLNTLAGARPIKSNSYNWTSYGYYISGNVSNYMWYIDVENDGEMYRGVYFTSYRPEYCGGSSSTGYTYQDDNGYTTSNIYWFKYEPISWTILNENNGTALILCDMIIDSQQFDYDGSYSSNYAESTIRKWLNETFYETAFDELQREIILTTEVDNSVASTGYSSNQYAYGSTNDKVFLLSYKELTTYLTTYASRMKKTTDYAQAQGACTYNGSTASYVGSGYWWLRSPNNDTSYYMRVVSIDGSVLDGGRVYYTSNGVVPALQIRL